jgi:hypothetical protein
MSDKFTSTFSFREGEVLHCGKKTNIGVVLEGGKWLGKFFFFFWAYGGGFLSSFCVVTTNIHFIVLRDHPITTLAR